MYKINKQKSEILDYENRVVGFIRDGKFSQTYRKKWNSIECCDRLYQNGLTPVELEQVSEVMQRAK
jgi:hypothetical protein